METKSTGISAQIGHNSTDDAEFKVFGDILRHSKIRIPPSETLQNHHAFLKKILLPAFLDLYKRWPAGYHLLMANGIIIKYRNSLAVPRGAVFKGQTLQELASSRGV